MEENLSIQKYQLKEDEKLNSVMVYTSHDIYWGDVVLKKQFRASTWLQTNAIPDFITLLNGKVIHSLVGGVPRPILIPEAYIPVEEIVFFHLTPPDNDPLEYNPNEPNMQTINVTINSGGFELDGKIRISSKTTLTQYLAITHESFYSIYDSSIRCLTMPSFGTIRVKFAIARIKNSILSVR
jgi:hypothetical protein